MAWNLSSPIWLTWQASMLTPWRSHLNSNANTPTFSSGKGSSRGRGALEWLQQRGLNRFLSLNLFPFV